MRPFCGQFEICVCCCYIQRPSIDQSCCNADLQRDRCRYFPPKVHWKERRRDKMMRVILETSPTLTPDITPPVLSLSLLGSLKCHTEHFSSFLSLEVQNSLGGSRYPTQHTAHIRTCQRTCISFIEFYISLHSDEMSRWFPIMFVLQQHFSRLKIKSRRKRNDK